MRRLLKEISIKEAYLFQRKVVNPEALNAAEQILTAIRNGGEDALRGIAENFGEIKAGAPLVIDRRSLEQAFNRISPFNQKLLMRVARRIEMFAKRQVDSLSELTMSVAGGSAGHTINAVERVGCYAPGGRYPLPSTVLMTTVTAKTAGVNSIWVATPKPGDLMLGAAYVGGAEAVLAVGGAQAVGAFAYGAGCVPRCDMVVGPGNKYVTAAKKLVVGDVGVDLLAGPSELLIVADESAEPDQIAADLLAQAEHDPDVFAALIMLERRLIDQVENELWKQLEHFPAREIAIESLANGFVVVVPDFDVAADLVNRLAPEHLELLVRDATTAAPAFRSYGAMFIGASTPEVLGDYGAGPNHTLPTGGSARFSSGLSVFSFLKVRTWLKIDSSLEAKELFEDAQCLAELEGLEGHARSARSRDWA